MRCAETGSAIRRRNRRLGAVLAGLALLAAAGRVLVAPPPAVACGPYFPPTLLGDESELRNLPSDPFTVAVFALPGLPEPRYPTSNRHSGARTAGIDLAQVAEAFGRRREPRPVSSPEAAYREVRAALETYREAERHWRHGLSWLGPDEAPPQPPELPADLAVPDGLPPELALYLEGALAYHRRDDAAARRAWVALLALPPEERRLRSTWAAYMLGRMELEPEPETLVLRMTRPAGSVAPPRVPAERLDAAVARLTEVRRLVDDGFPDPLELAAESLGWEARAHWMAGRWGRAFELYAEQVASGDRRGAESLHELCRRVLEAGDEALARVAASPLGREILTLYVAGHGDAGDDGGLTDRWIGALAAYPAEATGGETGEGARLGVSAAGLLAWQAYQGGRMGEAERWVELAESGDRRAAWVRSRLLLRAGRLDEARRVLAGLGDAPVAPATAHQAFVAQPTQEPLRAAGEAGALAAVAGDGGSALDALLGSGFWVDAVYVAESLMSLPQLTAHVDRRWPRALHDPRELYGATYGRAPLPDSWIAWRIRHLLARRLARTGQWREAAPYYPSSELTAVAGRMAHLQCTAEDSSRPRAERSAALWEMARTLRRRGMALTATGLSPDFQVWEGNFTYGITAPARAQHQVAPADRAEVGNWNLFRPEPDRRYHYRYAAAELAWRAAALMPDEDPATARVLNEAGRWLMYLDPPAADRFYKALVRRCGTTELGRRAARRHWFPPLPP